MRARRSWRVCVKQFLLEFDSNNQLDNTLELNSFVMFQAAESFYALDSTRRMVIKIKTPDAADPFLIF